MSKRYQRIDDVMFEVGNLEETADYCAKYNDILRGLASTSSPAVVLLDKVKQNTGGFTTAQLNAHLKKLVHLGELERAYNAWYTIEPFYPKQQSIPLPPGVLPGTHTVNFFVRMGREREQG